jgi:hypothetical protein
MLAVGRTVWDWAIPLGLVILNPFEKIKDLRVPDRGHVPWPEWARAMVMRYTRVMDQMETAEANRRRLELVN